jgi:hypothetical protein
LFVYGKKPKPTTHTGADCRAALASAGAAWTPGDGADDSLAAQWCGRDGKRNNALDKTDSHYPPQHAAGVRQDTLGGRQRMLLSNIVPQFAAGG